MALQTDDCDINDIRFWMSYGGNGDYYIHLLYYNEDRSFVERLDTRFAMSGGTPPTEVKLAVAALFRAMEAADLNKHPKEDKQ